MKGQADKLNCIKIKNICSAKDLVKRIKRQATDWEEMFANYIPAKELVSRIYKQLSKLNSKRYLIDE